MRMETLVPLAFTAPGPKDFDLPNLFGTTWLNRTFLLATLAALIVGGYFVLASSKLRVVPNKAQYLAETAYDFVRNTIARDMIGRDFIKYVPFVAPLFFFILVNDLFGSLPFLNFPTFSHIGWALALAIASWVVYNGAGIWVQGGKHGGPKNPLARMVVGTGRYLKLQALPKGVPPLMTILIVPLELISNIIIRPITLTLRLFANMFAGHLLIGVFILGGEYLVLHGHGLQPVAGVGAWLVGIPVALLEIFVQFMQAFIFAVLSAQYIGSAIADNH